MLGVPIDQCTVGGALLISITLLAAWAVLAATFGTFWLTVTVRRRRRARRVLDDLAVHLDDCTTADPQLAAGFDRLRAAIREQQKGDQG